MGERHNLFLLNSSALSPFDFYLLTLVGSLLLSAALELYTGRYASLPLLRCLVNRADPLSLFPLLICRLDVVHIAEVRLQLDVSLFLFCDYLRKQ